MLAHTCILKRSSPLAPAVPGCLIMDSQMANCCKCCLRCCTPSRAATPSMLEQWHMQSPSCCQTWPMVQLYQVSRCLQHHWHYHWHLAGKGNALARAMYYQLGVSAAPVMAPHRCHIFVGICSCHGWQWGSCCVTMGLTSSL